MVNVLSGALAGGSLLSVNSYVLTLGLQPQVLLISAICAAAGAYLLSGFTISLGFLTIPLNFAALLAGAIGANLVARYMEMPVDVTFVRPLIISFLGMTAAAVVVLVLLSRNRQGS
jgi:hypothetical protein